MTILCLDKHHQFFGRWSIARFRGCPGFAEPRSRSELASADQCLKFCDVTPSATTLSTLNNPRDLDLHCLAASFLVQWTQTHWNAGRPKRLCGVDGVQALCPGEPQSCCSRYGELPIINLVRVRYVFTVINTVYFSIRLHKTRSVSAGFETATKTITLCKKCFLPLSSRPADISFTLWPDNMLNFIWTNHVC